DRVAARERGTQPLENAIRASLRRLRHDHGIDSQSAQLTATVRLTECPDALVGLVPVPTYRRRRVRRRRPMVPELHLAGRHGHVVYPHEVVPVGIREVVWIQDRHSGYFEFSITVSLHKDIIVSHLEIEFADIERV